MSSLRPPAASPLQTRYAPVGSPMAAYTLARLRFGTGLAHSDDPRDVIVPLSAPDICFDEIWTSPLPVEQGHADGFGYAHNGEVLFAQIHLSEADLGNLDRATLRLYARTDTLLRKLGYPCWLRVWHYLANITQGDGDGERYRQFAQGRYHALALKPGFETQLPAATAIGTHGEGMTVFLLAAKLPGLQIENPRQTSAFRYPREYGPRSPSFSRATLKQWAGESHLYVSGTASIVGHESRHTGDAVAQLDEIHRNIEALLEQAAPHLPGSSLHPQQLKLYLRDRELLEPAQARARQLFGADTPLLVLEGDICRNDLLLEVEGLYTSENRAGNR